MNKLADALLWRSSYRGAKTPAQRRRVSYLIQLIITTEFLGVRGGNESADGLAMMLRLGGVDGKDLDGLAAWCELLCKTGYSPTAPPPALLTEEDPRPGHYYVVAVARGTVEAPEHSYYLHGRSGAWPGCPWSARRGRCPPALAPSPC